MFLKKGKTKNRKVHTRTGNEGPQWGVEVYFYSFFNLGALSLTSALDRSGMSTLRSGRFIPGMTQYSLYRKVGGPQGWFGRVRKIFPPSTRIRSPGHPFCRKSLYRLSYPVPLCFFLIKAQFGDVICLLACV